MICKYCSKECKGVVGDDYVSKYTSYCYECGKLTYTFKGQARRVLETIWFYFSIFFLPGTFIWKEWWKFIFERRGDPQTNWLTVIWCRWRGHPAGPVFYNVGGLEQDMSCINCGDEL